MGKTDESRQRAEALNMKAWLALENGHPFPAEPIAELLQSEVEISREVRDQLAHSLLGIQATKGSVTFKAVGTKNEIGLRNRQRETRMRWVQVARAMLALQATGLSYDQTLTAPLDGLDQKARMMDAKARAAAWTYFKKMEAWIQENRPSLFHYGDAELDQNLSEHLFHRAHMDGKL